MTNIKYQILPDQIPNIKDLSNIKIKHYILDCPLWDSIIVYCSYATYYMEFILDRLNPYATTPLQVNRTIPIYHELSSQAKTSFTDVFSLLMRSRGYALRCDFQCTHGFIARRWDVAFIWNQLVYHPGDVLSIYFEVLILQMIAIGHLSLA